MKKALTILNYVTIINFFAAMYGSIYFGGSALNGKIEAGRYFLGSHGKFTEASKNIFEYSRVHFISVFVLNAATIIFTVLFKPTARDMKWPTWLIIVLGAIMLVFQTLKSNL